MLCGTNEDTQSEGDRDRAKSRHKVPREFMRRKKFSTTGVRMFYFRAGSSRLFLATSGRQGPLPVPTARTEGADGVGVLKAFFGAAAVAGRRLASSLVRHAWGMRCGRRRQAAARVLVVKRPGELFAWSGRATVFPHGWGAGVWQRRARPPIISSHHLRHHSGVLSWPRPLAAVLIPSQACSRGSPLRLQVGL